MHKRNLIQSKAIRVTPRVPAVDLHSSVDAGTLENDVLKLALGGKLAGAARRAIRANRKGGVPITFKRGARVIKEYSDGRTEVLETITPVDYSLPKSVKVIGRR